MSVCPFVSNKRQNGWADAIGPKFFLFLEKILNLENPRNFIPFFFQRYYENMLTAEPEDGREAPYSLVLHKFILLSQPWIFCIYAYNCVHLIGWISYFENEMVENCKINKLLIRLTHVKHVQEQVGNSLKISLFSRLWKGWE